MEELRDGDHFLALTNKAAMPIHVQHFVRNVFSVLRGLSFGVEFWDQDLSNYNFMKSSNTWWGSSSLCIILEGLQFVAVYCSINILELAH